MFSMRNQTILKKGTEPAKSPYIQTKGKGEEEEEKKRKGPGRGAEILSPRQKGFLLKLGSTRNALFCTQVSVGQ